MIEKDYRLNIILDGSDAQAEAGRLHKAIAASLAKGLVITGKVDITGLDTAQNLMRELRADAGALGRAISAGLSQQWSTLETRLAGIQSQISGIVRAGTGKGVAEGILGSMPEYANAMSTADRAATGLAMRIKDLNIRYEETARRMAELRSVPVVPLGGGATSTIGALAKAFESSGYKAYITRIKKQVDTDKELLRMEADLRVQMAAAARKAEESGAVLAEKMAEVTARMDVALTQRPPGSAVSKEFWSEARVEWEAGFQEMITERQELDRQLTAARSVAITGDTEDLKSKITRRRRELAGPMTDDKVFWKEWAMGSVDSVAQALRQHGQRAAAESLEQMQALLAQRKTIEKQLKGAVGRVAEGLKVELPAHAKGTLIDFVAAEGKLAEMANVANDAIKEQSRLLRRLVTALDEARRASEGLSMGQRKAVSQLELQASREIRQRTPARVSLEDTGEISREVLARLAQEVQTTVDHMQKALATPVTEGAEQQARGLVGIWRRVKDVLVGHSIIPEMVDDINQWLSRIGEGQGGAAFAQITGEASQASQQVMQAMASMTRSLSPEQLAQRASALREELRKLNDDLAALMATCGGAQAEAKLGEIAAKVAQAVAIAAEQTRRDIDVSARQVTQISDMLSARSWGGRAGAEKYLATQLTGLQHLEQKTRAIKVATDDLTEAVHRETKARTNATRSQRSPAVQQRLLTQTISGEKQLTDQMRQREHQQRRLAMLETEGKRLASELGQEWTEITQEMRTSGDSLESVVSKLQHAAIAQRRLREEAGRTRKEVQRIETGIMGFAAALGKARTQTSGFSMLAGDIQRLGRGLQFAGAAITGALTIAGRNFVEFAKQTDVASRSMLLNRDLSRQMRQEIIDMSANMGMLDPQEMATGITIWAQATGQQVESSSALNRVLTQTISMQQLAELSQTQLSMVTDGTASAIRQFGLTLNDTNRIVAVYNKTANDTLASVSDMATAFKFIGPQASNMGESLESAAAVIGLLADQNIRGSMAGRAYRKMLTSLTAPSKAARDMLQKTFGEDSPFFDEGTFVGMAKVIDLLAAATADMTEEERGLLISTLFTDNAIAGATALINLQTEARQRGINAIRAQTNLIEGSITDEVRAYGVMKREIEGVNIAMMGATELWNTQLEQWNESDVRRVQQAEMRWKAFWLSIGEQVINFVLPALEAASELLVGITEFSRDTPAFVKTALGTATAAGALGTAVSAVGGLLRAIGTLKTVTIAMESMAAAQTAAAAAQTTAAAAQTASAAAGGAAALGGGIAIGTGKAALGGGLAIGGGAAISVVAAAATAALAALPIGILAFELLAKTKLGKEIGLMSGTTGKIAGIAAHAIGSIFGKGDEWLVAVARFTGVMDEMAKSTEAYNTAGARAITSTALTARAMDAAAQAGVDYSDAGARVAVMLKDAKRASADYSDAGVRAARSTRDLAAGIEELGDAGAETTRSMSGEQGDRAIALYTQYLNDVADATAAYSERMRDMANDLSADLAGLDLAHAGRIAELAARHQETVSKTWDTYFAAQTKRAQDHVRDLQRLDEDHEGRLSDAITRRDATAALQEIRNYEKQRRRKIEDYSTQQSRAAEQYQRTADERQRNYDLQIEQLQHAHKQERDERISAYNDKRVEEEREHRLSLNALRQDTFNKINEEVNYYTASQAVQRMWRARMLLDTWQFMQANRSLWQEYLNTLPAPSYGGTYPDEEYQSGGYVARTAPALVHQGEFVLTAQTANALEGAGGKLTQASFTGGRAVNISMPITASFAGGIAAGDRAWIQGDLRLLRQEILRDVTTALEAA